MQITIIEPTKIKRQKAINAINKNKEILAFILYPQQTKRTKLKKQTNLLQELKDLEKKQLKILL